MRIGEALAGARRQADLTVAEVSERTRIRATIIRAIENDDYSACGGDFYARGHIRSIAKVVGTDPELLIREYDTAHRASGRVLDREPGGVAGQRGRGATASRPGLDGGPGAGGGRPRVTAALAVPGGSAGGPRLGHAAALAVPDRRAGRSDLDHAAACLTGELAAATWTTVRLRVSRSALGTAAGPALGRARHRLSRTAALGLVAAMFTTARLALSRSLRRGPTGGAPADPPSPRAGRAEPADGARTGHPPSPRAGRAEPADGARTGRPPSPRATRAELVDGPGGSGAGGDRFRDLPPGIRPRAGGYPLGGQSARGDRPAQRPPGPEAQPDSCGAVPGRCRARAAAGPGPRQGVRPAAVATTPSSPPR